MPNEAPAPLNVDPESLRKHATSIQQLMTRTTAALEAASYIAAADDAYGAIPRPVVDWLLSDNHSSTVEVIRKLAEKVAEVPGKLNADADSFEGADGALSQTLEGLQTAIENSKGVQ
ncbi:type VII secretion target [Nocardia sp. NPDC019395]|uniref:type VII secretion target n=1 Tax=Nocardia sp. NPDC019395 TaxID=3154686 RepID=UPI0034084E35